MKALSNFPKPLMLGMMLWLATAGPVKADSMLLIQGYLGSAGSWRTSGITAILHHRGWRDGGHLSMRRGRVVLRRFARKSPNRFYTLDLPTEAPIGRQANILAFYIADLEARHAKEPIILVGHSAGGVVARLELVRSRRNSLQSLITIASPHLGTRVAELGSTVANSPLGWVAPMMGAGTINRSRGLYRDLSREHRGNLLGWLNRQKHPQAEYVSVIRIKNGRAPRDGDSLVQGFSQDMNSVAALRGRSRRIFSPGDHSLRRADGHLLIDILKALKARRR